MNTEDTNGKYDDSYSEEEAIVEIPKEVRKINTQAYDKSVADLVRMMNDGDINLNPEYQRNYIWDNKRASLLIESILLNVPIPVIYVSQEDDDSWTVIDGLQRLNSIKRFYERDFKLSGMEVLSDLNKSDVKTLNPKALRVLNNGLLRVIVVSNDSHPEIKYDVFMRLNRGSVKLNEQELRNCLYRGSLNVAIKDMASNPDFLVLLNQTEPHKRMTDCELILRFLALDGNWNPDTGEIEYYKGRMKVFLNDFMIRNQNADKNQIEGYKTKFSETANKVLTVFGEKAFRRLNEEGEYETSLNRSLMDILMLSLSKYSKEAIAEKKDVIANKLVELLRDNQEFKDSIMIGTSDVKVIKKRLSIWYSALTEILNGQI